MSLLPPIPARTLLGFVLCLALLAPACSRRAARTIPPVLVPSIETQPQPAPEPQPEPAASTTPAPETSPAATPPNAQRPRPKRRKTVTRKAAPVEASKPETPKPEAPKAEAAKPETPKLATPDSSVQITADVPRAAVQTQTQNTEQLLRSSQAALAGISRALNESEQAMARQARDYITQSSQAVRDGDIDRAYNLAVKASLLANELAK